MNRVYLGIDLGTSSVKALCRYMNGECEKTKVNYDGHKQIYNLDFSSLGNLPAALDKQGFSVLCDGCKQFVSVMFDAEMALVQVNIMSVRIAGQDAM